MRQCVWHLHLRKRLYNTMRTGMNHSWKNQLIAGHDKHSVLHGWRSSCAHIHLIHCIRWSTFKSFTCTWWHTSTVYLLYVALPLLTTNQLRLKPNKFTIWHELWIYMNLTQEALHIPSAYTSLAVKIYIVCGEYATHGNDYYRISFYIYVERTKTRNIRWGMRHVWVQSSCFAKVWAQ